MPRLEVELTSERSDGTWTWRKAGARQPKGDVSGSLLPAGAKVGDTFRVEADVLVDGIEIVEFLPNKAPKNDRFERIELQPKKDPSSWVTETRAPKGRGRGRDGEGRPRRDRGDRPDRGDRGPRSDRNDRGPRGEGFRRGERNERGDRPQRRRPPALELPERPKPKRIRPGRAHRGEVLAALPPEQRPVAEQALQGGIPAVRAAIEQQNTSNRAQGLPEVEGTELLTLAEQLLPRLKAAEWLDRAEAAVQIIDEVDLKDLRSVVVAADSAGKDDRIPALKAQLSEAYTRRADEEHTAWLQELTMLLDAERVVRALRVSSRPPKAGVPLPKELADRLAKDAGAALTAETFADRWDTVLDALSFSPVRTVVKATSIPETVSDELRATVEAFAERMPQIAEQFGIDPATVPKNARRKRDRAKSAAAKAVRDQKAPQAPRQGRRPDDSAAAADPAPTAAEAEELVADEVAVEKELAAEATEDSAHSPDAAVEPAGVAASEAVLEAELSAEAKADGEDQSDEVTAAEADA
jgi:hypothetical protein